MTVHWRPASITVIPSHHHHRPQADRDPSWCLVAIPPPPNFMELNTNAPTRGHWHPRGGRHGRQLAPRIGTTPAASSPSSIRDTTRIPQRNSLTPRKRNLVSSWMAFALQPRSATPSDCSPNISSVHSRMTPSPTQMTCPCDDPPLLFTNCSTHYTPCLLLAEVRRTTT